MRKNLIELEMEKRGLLKKPFNLKQNYKDLLKELKRSDMVIKEKRATRKKVQLKKLQQKRKDIENIVSEKQYQELQYQKIRKAREKLRPNFKIKKYDPLGITGR